MRPHMTTEYRGNTARWKCFTCGTHGTYGTLKYANHEFNCHENRHILDEIPDNSQDQK